MTNAERALEQIERTVVHVHYRTRMAVWVLLGSNERARNVVREPITARQLENYAHTWAKHVPDPPEARAALAHQMGQKYPFVWANTAQLRAALSVDEADVQASYREQFDTEIRALFGDGEAYTPDMNDMLLSRAGWWHAGRGEAILKDGETAKRLMVLVDGRLRETFQVGGRTETIELEPGDMIGDVELWTGQRHTLSLIALRESSLVTLSREDFDELSAQFPTLMRAVAAKSVRELREVVAQPTRIPTTETFALLPIGPLPDAFYTGLREALEPFGAVLWLSPDDVRAQLAETGFETLADYIASDAIRDWLTSREDDYRYVVLVGDGDMPVWDRRIIERADRVVFVGKREALASPGRLEAVDQDILRNEAGVPRHMVILHPHRNTQPSGTKSLLAGRQVNRFHHIVPTHPPDMARLSRSLRGREVGVVLGGGGMRGAAHLGVLRAMNELGIPIDFAGGTSAGAIVAAQAGLEWSPGKMLEETKNKILTRKAIRELTLPIVSISSAHTLNAAYVDMFGGYDVEDLWIPIFTIASNLTQARMEIMDRGSLHRAVRASSSLAGVHPPTIAPNNDLLIDGGGFNNTPADVMRTKVGRGTVIAVDMGFTKREFPTFNYGDSLSGWRVFWNRINPFRKERLNVPLITTTMLRANALWSIRATEHQISRANLVLEPPVSEYGLFDIHAADDLFEAGYQDGMKRLQEWLSEGALKDTLNEA